MEACMSGVINLNQQRKAKAKDAKEKQAASNRVKFGRTKEEKRAQQLKDAKAKQLLDGHKLDKDET
jgi:hypothetical protein